MTSVRRRRSSASPGRVPAGRGPGRRRGATGAEPSEARPFLKWAGGKRQLIGQLWPHLPDRIERYHEPFLGGAALFFALRARLGRKYAYLSDTNIRLIRTYRGLRDDPDGVVRRLRSYPHDKAFFLRLRRWEIDDGTDAEVAAWFIYLNKTAYNGLYRVNRRNLFNVPFGDYRQPNICDEPTLRLCASRLRPARIEQLDFERAARRARPGDLVYFDPPYVPLSKTSSFTSYTSGGFTLDEHRRLRDVALGLKQRGVCVLVSNSSARAVRELYGGSFDLVSVRARRPVNSRADKRGAVTELLMR
ncbi:MAG: DNA adenine methylase [Deltaproteobacteria bacterium]|jgi:DNA adenine methylase|nr:DNA adenine methylase [Deltaproteobacteria bacterium]MBW2535097.1 DNA adenine methylase [Deltaproteobacteria bacterium]